MKWFFILFLSIFTLGCTDSTPDINISSDIDADLSPLAEIYAPEDGAILPADTPFALDYAVVRGTKGTYVEIQVDKGKASRVVLLSGRHFVQGLAPGKHRLSVTEYDKKGKPTGARAAVNITVK
jgi:hypothetical protein